MSRWSTGCISNTPSVNLFYQPLIARGVTTLDAEESRHCIRVLRKKAGDRIRITDGNGAFYEAVIVSADPHACAFSIEHTIAEPLQSYSVHIAVAPTKNTERIEWFVEKSVELGINQISFVDCEHSERTQLKMARIEKIAISAMKQSLRASVPRLQGPMPFPGFIAAVNESNRFIAHAGVNHPPHLKDSAPRNGNYIVVIGPEGDFTEKEIQLAQQAAFTEVSLGPGRLRTETAALAACHILNLINH